jgi:molybdate transport system substrate-binding protein
VRLLRLAGALAAASMLVVGCGARGGSSIRVLAASSLTNAFDSIATAFEAETGIDVIVSTAGSATVRTQVVEGAPADVVALADEATMAELVAADVLHPGSEPAAFASNHLVLVVPRGNPAGVEGIHDLRNRLLATCAPHVPCGRLAQDLALAQRVVLIPTTEPPNVRSVLSAVELGEVDAGLVYASDISDRVEVVAVPGTDEIETIYPIVAVTDRDESRRFVDFVTSAAGALILADHAFGPPR